MPDLQKLGELKDSGSIGAGIDAITTKAMKRTCVCCGLKSAVCHPVHRALQVDPSELLSGLHLRASLHDGVVTRHAKPMHDYFYYLRAEESVKIASLGV